MSADHGASPGPSQPALTVRQLHKRYGNHTALESLDLQVERGSVFGLLGPNGAGKTTTFGILCGFLSPTSGHAAVLDTPVQQLHRLRGRVAALPQDTQFPAHVRIGEQLRHFGRLMGLSADVAQREASRVLEAVGLPEVAKRKGDELSHGMAKRVGLAQAMIGPPEVVFLDEPTAGLDPRSSHQVKSLIEGMAPRTTVVLSSHNLVDVQEICTHGTVIQHGRVVASGTMETLTRRGNQVSFDLRRTTPSLLPWTTLKGAFGDEAVRLEPQPEHERLVVTYAASRNPSDVIGQVLTLLLEAKVPILGVTRGTSLETAFLEATDTATDTAPGSKP